MRSSSLRTLLVGIDGASPNVLDPLLDEGALPTLASVFREGASGRLESQIPPWTASAWPSIYTGVNPGQHGVFGFLTFDGYDWGVVNATHVDARPIWQLLDEVGQRSVVVNVPVTHPPRPFDGALLPGYAAPEDPTCHPEGLLEDVREAIGEYRVYGAGEGEDATGSERDALVAEYRRLVEVRGQALRYLLEEFEPDFAFVQFQQTDTVCHELPGDRSAYRAVYRAVDGALADVLAAHDPDDVVVVSDHGLGPYEGRVAGNEVLRSAGYVEGTTRGEGMPTWARIRDDDLREREASLGARAVERAAGLLGRVGVSAQRVGAVLGRLGLADRVRPYVPDDAIRDGSEQVDFAGSAAYFRSRIECGVRINLEGREPDGVVPAEDYEDVRDELIYLLSDVSDDAGATVFEDVGRAEEYFEGPHADDGPDVVAVPRDFDHYLTTWLTGEPYDRVEEPAWDHKRHGVVAAAGADVDPSADLDDAHVFDVAPTVLATMGVPADERMDGTTLPFVDGTGRRAYGPVDSREATTTDSETVEARLEDLGYLE